MTHPATFKPILLSSENADAIVAALAAVNGRAMSHTYTTYDEVSEQATLAEGKLTALLYKKDLPGARYSGCSGAAVPHSYRGKRIGTAVELERKTKGWYLVELKSLGLHNDGGGRGSLWLTPKQDQDARKKLAEGYQVIADPVSSQP